MSEPSLASLKDKFGELPAFAWPGGYQIIYSADDGASICPKCANSEDFSIDEKAPPDGFRLDGWFIHYEGPPEQCAHCNELLESAYGELEETE